MKKILTMFLAFVIITSLTACSNATAEVDTTMVTIAMTTSSEPEYGFDPVYGWGAGEHVHEPLIQSTLTVTTTDLEIDYDIATDIQVSDDGLIWTVTIRDDVYFTNGDKLTAEDVAFTYNTVKENSSTIDFTMLEEAVAEDETTVVFYLNQVYSIFSYTMANIGIVPKDYYSDDYGQNPVGSGPYILKQWDKGQQIILEANPDYYGDAPEIETVVILFMSEDAAFAAVKAGQIDVAYTSAMYSEQEIDGYSLFSVETVDNRGINLPTVSYDGEVGNDVTADDAIRAAINVGIDREKLIEDVLLGHGTVAYSVCDDMPWFDESVIVEYDFELAEQILADGGWVKNEDGILEKDGLLAEFEILYPSDDSVRQAMAAEICNQLLELGIKVTYRGVGWDTAYDEAFTQPLVWGWGSHTPIESYNIYHTESGSEYARYTAYSNETVDALMDEALETVDLEESFTYWQEAQVIADSDNAWIWLVNIDHLYWVRDDLVIAEQIIHPHGQGWSLINNIDEWSWAD